MSFLSKLWKGIVRPAISVATGGASEVFARSAGLTRAGRAPSQPVAPVVDRSLFDPPGTSSTPMSPVRMMVPRLPGPVRPGAGRMPPARGGGPRDSTGLGGLGGLGGLLGGDGETRRRTRRMNPINVKALRRAIRRVKAFKRIEKQVDKLLPKQRVTSRATPRRC